MDIYVKRVRKTIDGKTILDVNELAFPQGSFTMIIGPNGAGKSTLLKTLSQLDTNCEKEILYDGNQDFPQDQINTMVQHSYLFDLTVAQNLRIGAQHITDAQVRSQKLMEELDLLPVIHRRCPSLSGGEAQKVAFARTVLTQKPVLLLDEPTSDMDVAATKKCERILLDMNQKLGITIIMITHNPSQALRLASRILVMDQGKVIESGTPKHILEDPLNENAQAYLENWRMNHV